MKRTMKYELHFEEHLLWQYLYEWYFAVFEIRRKKNSCLNNNNKRIAYNIQPCNLKHIFIYEFEWFDDFQCTSMYIIHMNTIKWWFWRLTFCLWMYKNEFSKKICITSLYSRIIVQYTMYKQLAHITPNIHFVNVLYQCVWISLVFRCFM